MASVNKDNLERLYLAEKKSIPDISALIGVSRSTVRLRLIQFGIQLRSRKDGIAAVSHKLGAGLRGKKRVFTDEWKANLRAAILKGDRVIGAAGKTTKPSGYIEFTTGANKGRSEHAVIMERIIGRQLASDEVVHHKDENRSNNDPSNLERMTRSEHARLHAVENIHNRKRNEYGQFE